jgi:hypothetical protein
MPKTGCPLRAPVCVGDPPLRWRMVPLASLGTIVQKRGVSVAADATAEPDGSGNDGRHGRRSRPTGTRAEGAMTDLGD